MKKLYTMSYTKISDQVWHTKQTPELRDVPFSIPSGAELGRRAKPGYSPQLIINVPPQVIWDNTRVYGYVAMIRRDDRQVNTRSPFTLQVVVRLEFWDDQANSYNHVYVKVTAHTADYVFNTPVASTESNISVRLGDPVSGILKPTQATERTIQLKAWSLTTWREWKAAPRQMFIHAAEFCIDPEIVRELPALVSREFRNFTSAHQAYSAQIFPPIFDPNSLRAMASDAGSVDRIWEDGRGAVVRDPYHSGKGNRKGQDTHPETIPEDVQVEGTDCPSQAHWDTAGTEVSHLTTMSNLLRQEASYPQDVYPPTGGGWEHRTEPRTEQATSDVPTSGYSMQTAIIPPRPKPGPPQAPRVLEQITPVWDERSESFLLPFELERRNDDARSEISRLPNFRGSLPLGGPRLFKPPPPMRHQVTGLVFTDT